MFKQWRLTRRIDIVLVLAGLAACGVGSVLFILFLQGNGISFASARRILPAFLVGTAAVLVVVVVSTRVLLRRFVLDPLERISTFSRQVSLGNLHVRLDVPETDEIGEIGSDFNRMRRSVVRGIDLLRDVHIEHGRTLMEQGDTVGAIAEFQDALGIQPDSVEGRSELARARAFQGEIDTAVDYYRQILQSQPEDPRTQFNLGLLLAVRAEHKQAALRLNTALALFEARGEQAEAGSVKDLLADLDEGQEPDLYLLKSCRTETRPVPDVVAPLVAPAPPTVPWRNIGALGGGIVAVCALALFLLLRPASPPTAELDSALPPIAEPFQPLPPVSTPARVPSTYGTPQPDLTLPPDVPPATPPMKTGVPIRASGRPRNVVSKRATKTRSPVTKVRPRRYVAVRRQKQSVPSYSVATIPVASRVADCYNTYVKARDYRCRNRKN